VTVLVSAGIFGRKHFSTYWTRVRQTWNAAKADDIRNVRSFYVDDQGWSEAEAGDATSKKRRTFFVAELRGRIVGTVAVREAPGKCMSTLHFVS